MKSMPIAKVTCSIRRHSGLGLGTTGAHSRSGTGDMCLWRAIELLQGSHCIGVARRLGRRLSRWTPCLREGAILVEALDLREDEIAHEAHLDTPEETFPSEGQIAELPLG